MLRFVLTIFFVLSSTLASMAATEHASGMAFGQPAPAMTTGHDHAEAMPHHTPPDCETQGDCPPEAALCHWVCAGLAALAGVSATGDAAVQHRTARSLPMVLTRVGISPDLSERPPQLFRL